MPCMIKESTWRDVMMKAKRIRSSGGVLVRTSSPSAVEAEVFGDNFNYRTTVEFGRNRSIAHFECGCGWGAYVWTRSDRYYGRMCSHALALQYEVQSRGMFGKDVGVDPDDAPWPSDIKQPGDWDYDIQGYPMSTPRKRTASSGGFKGKINGRVVNLQFDDGKVFYDGQEYRGEVLNPTYDPRAGLNFTSRASVATSAVADCDGTCDCTCHEYDSHVYDSATHHPCDCSCHDDVFPRTAAKNRKTARTNFTSVEQSSIINEGEGVRAANLDRLDLTNTHYIFDTADEEQDSFAWWL